MKISSFVTGMALAILIFTSTHPGAISQPMEGKSLNGGVKIKYVFYFIGDGMGLAQVNAAEGFRAALHGNIGLEHLEFTGFPNAGLVSTFAHNKLITCSAAAGTALATGNKTNNGRIGMDPSGEISYESIASKAKKADYNVGIVTNVSIDHATPAVFYAHQPDRNRYFEIGMELPASRFDFFAGGGFLMPDGSYDGKPVNLIQLARDSGYQVVETRAAFEQLSTGSGKALVLSPRSASEASLPYAIDMDPGDLTLTDYTAKAIEMLDNGKGFLLMVESGKIDWAGHINDAATLVQEIEAFDQCIGKAVEFLRKHPDETLIVVTADHETGGMAMGHRDTKYESNLGLLKYQKSSEEAMIAILNDFGANKTNDTIGEFKRMLKVLENEMGLNSRLHETLLDSTETSDLIRFFKAGVYGDSSDRGIYGNYEPFISEAITIMNKKAGISWASSSHTGISVPVFATGAGADRFSGYIDNTDIPKFIAELMGLE